MIEPLKNVIERMNQTLAIARIESDCGLTVAILWHIGDRIIVNPSAASMNLWFADRLVKTENHKRPINWYKAWIEDPRRLVLPDIYVTERLAIEAAQEFWESAANEPID